MCRNCDESLRPVRRVKVSIEDIAEPSHRGVGVKLMHILDC